MNGYPTIEAKIGQRSIPLAKLKPSQVSPSRLSKHINDPVQIKLAIPFYQKGILDSGHTRCRSGAYNLLSTNPINRGSCLANNLTINH